MKEIKISFELQTLPSIIKRRQTTLILVRNTTGNFLLGCKDIYPEGIARMVGGGVDGDEDPHLAAVRELGEELQLSIEPNRCIPLAKVENTITHNEGTYTYVVWLHFLQLKSDEIPHASDDIDALIEVSESELQALIERYSKLSTQTDEELGFAWSDYGKIFTKVHQIALEEYKKLAL